MTFHDLLKNRETVFGVFAKTSDPLFVQILGMAGFDFVILDNEHGPNSVRDLLSLILAAENSGLHPIVRVSRLDPVEMQRTLDLGISGIQVPQINTGEDARNVVRYAKFHPLGMRGMCTFVRPAGFSLKEKKTYFEEQNQVSTIIHIEGMDGVNNLSSILEVEGIDVVFIGPTDLSQSMGIPGQLDHPELLKTIEWIAKEISTKNKHIGIIANSPERVKRYQNMGIKYIAYSADVGIFANACSGIVNSIKGQSGISE